MQLNLGCVLSTCSPTVSLNRSYCTTSILSGVRVLFIAFSANCPSHASALPRRPRRRRRKRFGCAFVAPLSCVSYGPFWRPRHYDTLKTLQKTATGRADRTADRTKDKSHHRAPHQHYTTKATYCNPLQPTPTCSSLASSYRDPLIWSWGLSSSIILPRTAPALLNLLRSVHTLHQQPLRHTRDMGPGFEKSPRRAIIEPPKISNSSDLASWKRNVANWVDVIIAGSEKGEDRMFKSFRAILFRQFYKVGLNHSHHGQDDYAQLQAG